jgi:hypothetical protein
MADTDNYIVDSPLPDALNAEQLKNQGIAMLQSMVGEVWTNYNDSDPGITILDQLCYALTELGYCGQFPIEDVLTQENGKIDYYDQFFEPQNILTSSPVTTDDYRKLVLDAIPEIRAIYIEAETVTPDGATQLFPTGFYNSYISLKNTVSQKTVSDQIAYRVQVLLNQHRNLGELFLPPVMLNLRSIELVGQIILAPSAEIEKVCARILGALRDYAVPMAVQSGYTELVSAGIDSDQIFNGPKLKNGWIAGSDAIQGKRQRICIWDLATLFAKVDGVLSVQTLNFDAQSVTEISIDKNEIPSITLSSKIVFMRNGVIVTARQTQSKQHYLEALSAIHQAASVSSSVDLYPPLPTGKYRDIEEYYSVQNTFPDIYGIGYNSWRSDTASYRVARSRQLKGYLMAFDQLLANQFSQLAHVGDLYSFRYKSRIDATVADPVTPFGIPYEKFVTTYYCQPLYDIPDVKPLLLGNEVFHYQYDRSKSEKEIEETAWKKYREFQFNEYIYGLRQIVENNTEAMTRRDAMLSHLMARHGDDASLYDDMIAACQWFGGELKTRIIVKNIWMQNFELLSYHRTRAFDFYSSRTLPLPGTVPSTDPKWWRGLSYPAIDGEVDQTQIYASARLDKADLQNFSAFELKAGILLGLPARWRALAGKLMALLDEPTFASWLQQPSTNQQSYALPDSDISVKRGSGKNNLDQLFEGSQCLMDIAWPAASSPATLNDYRAHAEQLFWLSTQTVGFLLVESVLLWWGQGHTNRRTSSMDMLNVCLLFPGYVTLIQQPEFAEFINTLVDYHWPTHIEVNCNNLSFTRMQSIIASYVAMHNSFNDASALMQSSGQLAKLLSPLKKANREAAS